MINIIESSYNVPELEEILLLKWMHCKKIKQHILPHFLSVRRLWNE